MDRREMPSIEEEALVTHIPCKIAKFLKAM